MKRTLCTALSAFSFVLAASAADAMHLQSEVFQEVEAKNAAGRPEKKLAPAVSVVPGSDVIYVITYRNDGSAPADQVVINNPIPATLEYRSETASGAGVTSAVSVDGGRSYGKLAGLKVAGSDGKQRAAQPADVTHVRWALDRTIAPGEEGKVTYRARLK